MRQHSSALERKWNRQFTRPIFPAGTKNAVWEQDQFLKSSTVHVPVNAHATDWQWSLAQLCLSLSLRFSEGQVRRLRFGIVLHPSADRFNTVSRMGKEVVRVGVGWVACDTSNSTNTADTYSWLHSLHYHHCFPGGPSSLPQPKRQAQMQGFIQKLWAPHLHVVEGSRVKGYTLLGRLLGSIQHFRQVKLITKHKMIFGGKKVSLVVQSSEQRHPMQHQQKESPTAVGDIQHQACTGHLRGHQYTW